MQTRLTQADVDRINAKNSRKAADAAPDAWTGKEADLHRQIEDELKRRRWLYFHGSMAHRQMRTLGEPDFQVFADGGRFWLIECKTAKGKLSIEQMAIRLMAESLGHTVHIIRSHREFLNLVDKPERCG